jgi:hypothetical protein
VILLYAEAHVAEDLAEQRSDDDMVAVIGDDDDGASIVAEGVVAAFAAHPFESGGQDDFFELAVGHHRELAHATTSTRQVAT